MSNYCEKCIHFSRSIGANYGYCDELEKEVMSGDICEYFTEEEKDGSDN